MVVWLRGQSGRFGVTGGMHIAVSGCPYWVTGGVLVTRRVLNTNEGGG